MRELKGATGKLRVVVYSPDGSRLATAGDSGVTKLWDVATGRDLATIYQPEPQPDRADERRVGHLAFSPDGKLLATGTQRLRLWNVETALAVPFPEGALGDSRNLAMAFTPDNASLVIARSRYTVLNMLALQLGSNVLTYNRQTEKYETPFGQVNDSAEALAISASADLLAVAVTGSTKNRVRLWSLSSNQEQGMLDLPTIPMAHLPSIGLRAAVQGMAFSPDGRTLAVAAGTVVFIWDVPGRKLRGTLEGHADQVAAVAYSPVGNVIATGSQDGTVRLWDAQTLSEKSAYDWKIGKVRSVAFSPDGMTAAAVGEKAKVLIWDVE